MTRCIPTDDQSIKRPEADTAPPVVSVIDVPLSERNEKLKSCTSKYVFFPEPGEVLKENAIAYLLASIQGVGMASCGYECSGSDSPETVPRVLASPDMAARLFFRMNDQSMTANKLFRTAIINAHDIRFHPEYGSECESAFICEYLLFCGSVRMAPARMVEIKERPFEEDFEKSLRQLDGIARERKLLSRKRDFREAFFLCNDLYSDLIFSFFTEIADEDEGHLKDYAASALRRHARKLPFLAKRPPVDDPESRMLYDAMIRYGFTGNSSI